MPVHALVFRRRGERELVGRTLRALAAAGIGAEDARADTGRAIERVGGPVWLVRAGAWPAHTGTIAGPPPSATGRPLVAFGAVNGGPVADGSYGPASLYLESEPAIDLCGVWGTGATSMRRHAPSLPTTAGGSSDSRRWMCGMTRDCACSR